MQEFQKELGQWRKDPAGPGGKKKPKYSYRTVDELKAKGKLAVHSVATTTGELAQVKVCLNCRHHGTDHQALLTLLQCSNKLIFCLHKLQKVV